MVSTAGCKYKSVFLFCNGEIILALIDDDLGNKEVALCLFSLQRHALIIFVISFE